jgi:hypothetical protein
MRAPLIGPRPKLYAGEGIFPRRPNKLGESKLDLTIFCEVPGTILAVMPLPSCSVLGIMPLKI